MKNIPYEDVWLQGTVIQRNRTILKNRQTAKDTKELLRNQGRE